MQQHQEHDNLVSIHRGLLFTIINRFRRGHRFGRSLDSADAFQEAAIALMKAAKSYDPNVKGASTFAGYAYIRIWYHLVRKAGGERLIRIPTHVLDRCRGGIDTKTGRPIPVAYSCGILHDEGLEDYRHEDPVHAAAAADKLAVLKGLLGVALQTITHRHRLALILRYGLSGHHPCTLEEMTRYLGVTRERVRQILASAERKIWAYANSSGLRQKIELVLRD